MCLFRCFSVELICIKFHGICIIAFFSVITLGFGANSFHDFLNKNFKENSTISRPTRSIKIFSNQSRFSTIYSNNSEKYFIQRRPGNLDITIDSYFRLLPSTNFSSKRLKLKAENIQLENKRKSENFYDVKTLLFLETIN